MPVLEATVAMPGIMASAARQSASSPDRNTTGMPRSPAIYALIVNSEASSPLMRTRWTDVDMVCDSGFPPPVAPLW